MDYKNHKSGGKFGGAGIKSGYIRPRDHMAPYRHTPPPETEYERKVRNAISMSETKGPSGFSSDYKRYPISRQINNAEVGMDRKEVQDLITASLKDTFKRFVEEHGVDQVPTEVVLAADDAAYEAIKRMQNAGQTEVEEQEPVDIGKLNESRQEHVAEKWKEADQATTLDEAEKIMSEIRDMNSGFFTKLDSLPSETADTRYQNETESAINEVNPLFESAGLHAKAKEAPEFVSAFDLTQDANLEVQKPKRLDYDSEVEGY